MPIQKNLGENADIDADNPNIEDVSYEPTELDADSHIEKSDAQRIADGDIDLDSGEDEIFINPGY